MASSVNPKRAKKTNAYTTPIHRVPSSEARVAEFSRHIVTGNVYTWEKSAWIAVQLCQGDTGNQVVKTHILKGIVMRRSIPAQHHDEQSEVTASIEASDRRTNY